MYVPKRSYRVEQRIKNSRFIATAEPFDTPNKVKDRIEEIRNAHPGCAHVVYAFSVGDENQRAFGTSDDGEPKGTAGRPALGVLRGSEVTNCLVTVVRYFGGTKLGTGGLVRAYGGAVREVLEGLAVERLVQKRGFALVVPYELHDTVRRELDRSGAQITSEEFTETVRVTGTIAEDVAALCAERLREATRGTIRFPGAEGHENDHSGFPRT